MLTDPAALALVARYRSGVALVEAALAGATDADLDRRGPAADDWCARQVVHHLADSETNSYVRLRRLLAEPSPTTIQGYDEAHWATVLHYDRPIDASLAVFRAVRASSWSCSARSATPTSRAPASTPTAARTRSPTGSRSTPTTPRRTPPRSARPSPDHPCSSH